MDPTPCLWVLSRVVLEFRYLSDSVPCDVLSEIVVVMFVVFTAPRREGSRRSKNGDEGKSLMQVSLVDVIGAWLVRRT
jgi:hypothetical protein